MIPLLAFDMSYKKVDSTFTEGDSGILGDSQFWVIIFEAFFHHEHWMSLRNFAFPQELFTIQSSNFLKVERSKYNGFIKQMILT